MSRGLVQAEKGTNKGDPYYKGLLLKALCVYSRAALAAQAMMLTGCAVHADIMKHVNTMQMEELSDDQIAAARARRSKER